MHVQDNRSQLIQMEGAALDKGERDVAFLYRFAYRLVTGPIPDDIVTRLAKYSGGSE